MSNVFKDYDYWSIIKNNLYISLNTNTVKFPVCGNIIISQEQKRKKWNTRYLDKLGKSAYKAYLMITF